MVEDPRPARRTWRAAAVAAIVLVVVGTIWVVGTAAADPNVAAVRALAADTLILEHRIGIPDAPNKVISAADAAQLQADATAKANSHYRGPLLATRLEQFKSAVDALVAGPASALDGGAKDIVFGKTTVGPDTATVQLRATTWASSTVNGKVSSPTSTDNWTFTFQKVNGQWFVTDVETDFSG